MRRTISFDTGSSVWDGNANLLSLTLGRKVFSPACACTYFSVRDKGVEFENPRPVGSATVYTAGKISEARAEVIRSNEPLNVVNGNWTLSLFALNNETALALSSDARPDGFCRGEKYLNAKTVDNGARVSMTLVLPETAKFHLAEFRQIGRLLDCGMPPDARYENAVMYNLVTVELPDMAVRFRLEDEHMQNLRARVWRHEKTFSLTLSWYAGGRLLMGAFENLATATADFKRWVREERGVRPFSGRADVPAWLRDIRLVVTADMMRPNRDVSHDFSDVVNLACDMLPHCDPKKVLFYLPGWQGAFDTGHPKYRPAPELGGEQGLGEMVKTLHGWGYRVMLHTTVFGVDPYVEDVEKWESAMRTDDKGKLVGWQLNREFIPGLISSDFRTGRIPLGSYARQCHFSLPVGFIPFDC